MSFSKTFYPLLSTDSTPEDKKTTSDDKQIVDVGVKHHYKQSIEHYFDVTDITNTFMLSIKYLTLNRMPIEFLLGETNKHY